MSRRNGAQREQKWVCTRAVRVLRALGAPSLLLLLLLLLLLAAAAAAGWLAGRKHAAPERRECARGRRSGHIDTLNEDDLQPKKHTM